MAKTATVLLTHTPTDDEMDLLVQKVVDEYGPNYGHVSWFISDNIPPAGYGTDITDQLEAHHRDTPGSVFLTVLMD